MATVEAKVYLHHHRSDGTYNVKIRIYHKNLYKFIDTPHYLCDKQLKKHPENKGEFLIKDPFIKNLMNKELDEHRLAISNLGLKLKLFSPDDLKSFLMRSDDSIDFIQFCEEFITELEGKGQAKHAANFKTVKNNLIDFFKRKKVFIDEINVDTLADFENYLRKDRTITRLNQFDEPVTTIQKAVNSASIHFYMRDLRALFNHARKKFNRKSLGIIRIEHYPFDEYKVIAPPPTRKRHIDVKALRSIRDCQPKVNSRAELARDLFMLSFYMCGINSVDLYKISELNIINGRLEYKRSKTRGRRKDEAFISIKIIKEARPLLQKYVGNLSQRYASIGGLNKALSKGMAEICNMTSSREVTLYWARHTVGNLGRNKCRMSTNDVALALNHVDQGSKTTDIYIDKDWSIVDELQKKVVKLLKIKNKVKTKINRKIKRIRTLHTAQSSSIQLKNAARKEDLVSY